MYMLAWVDMYMQYFIQQYIYNIYIYIYIYIIYKVYIYVYIYIYIYIYIYTRYRKASLPTTSIQNMLIVLNCTSIRRQMAGEPRIEHCLHANYMHPLRDTHIVTNKLTVPAVIVLHAHHRCGLSRQVLSAMQCTLP